MSNSANILTSKLEAFIRKYYTNQLTKGAILFPATALALFLASVGVESIGKFGTTTRMTIFYMGLLVLVGLAINYIFVPLARLSKLGPTISEDEAAKMIGGKFPDIRDRLLNTLQLQRDSLQYRHENKLLLASINQRIEQFRPIPFTSAIDLKENSKYLKYALIPLLLLVGIMAYDADVIKAPAERIINYNETYVEPAPFSFGLENKSLQAVEGEEIVLEVKVTGSSLPSSVQVILDGQAYRMSKESKNRFVFAFRPKKGQSVKFLANGVESRKYNVEILPRPILKGLEIKLDYPDYTGRVDETLEGVGDLNVPEGTVASWVIRTQSAEAVALSYNDKDTLLPSGMDKKASFTKEIKEPATYQLSTQNKYMKGADSAQYLVQVIKDQLPSISVQEDIDTTNEDYRFFSGTVQDDYGFAALQFTYTYIEGDRKGQSKTVNLDLPKGVATSSYMHFLDVGKLNLEPGEEIRYFFTVFDNDKVNGSKSARTPGMIYRMPTMEELEDKHEEAANATKNEMESLMSEAAEIKKKMREMRNELSNSKSISWQQKERMENLLDKHESLQNKVEQMKSDFKKERAEQEKFKEFSEDFLKKRDELEKLLDQLLTPEMKELMKELREMLDKMNKDGVQEKLEDAELDSEQMEKELERALEHYKQQMFQEELKDVLDDVEELKEKLGDLSEKMEDKNSDKDEIKEEQNKLEENLEKVKEGMEKLKEQNDELENKHDMEGAEEKLDELENEMKEAKENQENGKQKKASQSQKQSKQKAQELSDRLTSMQSESSAQSAMEDMEALRQLLENLITMSFEQEDIMDDIVGLGPNDPRYFEVGRRQKKLSDDAQIIKDSLFALSKRVIQIQPIVNREIGEINYYMEKAIADIGERLTGEARAKQQYIMTSTNNLALLLDEALQQMQQAFSQSQMSGNGMCSKPGGSGKGKPSSLPSMREMQEQLKNQLEGMKKQMGENGKKPGQKPGQKPGEIGTKPGENGKPGASGMPGEGEGMSEQLAKLAAQQAAIREQMKQLREELSEDGSGNGNSMNKIIEDMEKTEEDIIFQRITNETIQRQQDILTRLLEHEKAERERDWDEKRESREAKNEDFGNPDKVLEYKLRKQKELELLRTIPPDLRKYYKNKVNEYFNTVE